MSLVVYGIKNCNTVKSALLWLRERKVDFQFHDYKAKGIDEARLKKWCAEVGWESLVNKRGTTWRQLPPDLQERVKDQPSAIALMMERTSIIKRPLIESNNKVIALGFDHETYAKVLRRK
ncbi:MAG TPA: ArsC family reductase [Chryseosolibacter sp.]|nr:ArsC family reductase [Chryseosolibacter sp.]